MLKLTRSLFTVAILLLAPTMALTQRDSKGAQSTKTATVPTISSISPTSITAGGPGFTLTVNGTNYASGSVVVWNSTTMTTTYGGATKLTALIPNTLIAAAGTAQVKVYTSGRYGGTSNGVTFTMNAPATTTTTTTTTTSTTSTTSTTPTLTVSSTSLPSGTIGTPYSATLSASGGVTPYTWTITSYSYMPGGIDITSGGQLQGTPTQSGTFSCPVQVKDSSGITAKATLALTIAGSTTTTSTTTSTSTTPVSIVTTSTPNGTAGTAYPSTTLAASGGTPAYKWSVNSGALPPGLTLASTGALSGTPTTSGTYSFTAQVNDSASGAATHTYSLTVGASTTTTTTATGPVFSFVENTAACPVLDNTNLCGWSSNANGSGWHVGQDPTNSSNYVMAKEFICSTSPCYDLNYDIAKAFPAPGYSDIYISGNVYLAQPAAGKTVSAQRKLFYIRAEPDWWVFLKSEGGGSSANQLAFEGYNGAGNYGKWGFSTSIPFNTWFNVGVAIHANAPGASDGFVRVYLNGQLVSDMDLENVSVRGNFTSGINNVMVGSQLQGYAPSTDTYDEWRYWNNILMTTTLP